MIVDPPTKKSRRQGLFFLFPKTSKRHRYELKIGTVFWGKGNAGGTISLKGINF